MAKISFVIPAYNEEAVVAQCLLSIGKELEATPCEAEVVVVNNASIDGTREAVSAFAWARTIDEEKKGLVHARKAGFHATTGELIANIDADTMLPPGWLARVLHEFQADANLVALSGPYIYHDLPLHTRVLVKIFYFFGWLTHLFNHHVLGVGAMLQGGNFVIKREAWEKVGGFDTTISFYGEDTDVARRISKVGKVKWTWSLPMYTTGRRLAAEGLFKMGIKYSLNYLSITFRGRPMHYEYTDIRPDNN